MGLVAKWVEVAQREQKLMRRADVHPRENHFLHDGNAIIFLVNLVVHVNGDSARVTRQPCAWLGMVDKETKLTPVEENWMGDARAFV